MTATCVELPGGLWHEGRLSRKAVFRPLDGRLELAVLELADRERRNGNCPRFVTETLAVAVESIEGVAVDEGVTSSLCVADRQFLMLRLAALLEGSRLWLSFPCAECTASFDILLDRNSLPVKGAGAGFPVIQLEVLGNEVTFRVPNGSDQERIVFLSDEDALRKLLELCLLAVNGAAPPPDFADAMTDAEIGLIETALEEVSPVLSTRLLVNCPECRTEQVVSFNPYFLAGTNRNNFFQEIHALASAYHWSEREILALPKERRALYLRLIERSRGMYA